jgi:endonuclease/exonuclease/phosphatase (EEP) superfamily protein YafD
VSDKTRQGATTPDEKPSPAKRKRRVAITGCLLGIAIGLAGLALSRLGQLWIAFDVFSHFTLHYLILIFSFAVGLFMPRAKTLTALVLVIVLTGALSIWPHYSSVHAAAVKAPAADERVLKVASFNTWFFNDSPDLIIAELGRIDADVVALIEMNTTVQKAVGELKAKYPFQVGCPNIDDCDIAIISKYPLGNMQYKTRWAGPEYLRASLGADFGGVTVFGVHTTRFPHPRAQFKQIQAMASEVEKIAGAHIVMGDFNATPFSRVTQTFATEANLTRLTDLPTWPARLGLPQVAIDHVFVSEGIHALSGETIGNNAGSDHFPIAIQLAVPVK